MKQQTNKRKELRRTHDMVVYILGVYRDLL